MASSSACSFSVSFSLLPLRSKHNTKTTAIITKRPSLSLSAFAAGPRKPAPSRSSSSSSRSRTLAPRSSPAAAPPPPKKKHWKEGEYPGVSVGSLPPRRAPLENLKKKLEDRAEAKAWVPTVTETLADKIQKRQWEEALEIAGKCQDSILNYTVVALLALLALRLTEVGKS